jgi:hypothetical protein
MKLAVFEDFLTLTDCAEISHVVEKSLGPAWYPFVRVRSQADHETTLIYANPSAGKMHILIVNIEPSEATVVELNLTERNIQRWLKDPAQMRRSGEAVGAPCGSLTGMFLF